jgi:hypothetical protein
MNDYYDKAIQAIKDYDTKLTRKSWDKIAYEYDFLSSKTLCFLTGVTWRKLIKNVRIDKKFHK